MTGAELQTNTSIYVDGKPKNKFTITVRKNISVGYAFALSITLLNAKNMIVQGIPFLYNHNSLLNIMVLLFSFVLLLSAILSHDRKISCSARQFCLIAAIVLFWGASYFMRQELFSFYNVKSEFVYFLTYGLPALLIIPLVRQPDDILKGLYRYRWIGFTASTLTVFGILFFGAVQGAGTREDVYSMSFGRALMLTAVLFFSKWFQKKDIKDLLCGMLCTMYIFFFGSRFPLLCIAFFIAWKLLFNLKKEKTILLVVIGSAILLFVLMNLNGIVNLLMNFFAMFGIRSRALALITYGKIGYDDGRLAIYNRLWQKIIEEPLQGYGAAGGIIALDNGLPHNFILDIFANIGIVFGMCILLTSGYVIIHMYRKNKEFYHRELIVICISLFLPVVYLQTSFWTATFYWYLIALSAGRMWKGSGKTNE